MLNLAMSIVSTTIVANPIVTVTMIVFLTAIMTVMPTVIFVSLII
jgi:hypothetical protein